MARFSASSPPSGHGQESAQPTLLPIGPDRVSVLLPLPLQGAYDYLLPDHQTLEPGAIVQVPLGRRSSRGVVWDNPALRAGAAGESLPASRLKAVLERHDIPPLTAVARRFIEWLADYYVMAPGVALRMALSVPQALDPPQPITLYGRSRQGGGDSLPDCAPGPRMTPARRRVLATLAEGPARPLGELAEAAGVSTSVVKGLVAAGLVEATPMIPRLRLAPPDPDRPGPQLSPEQAAAADQLTAQARGSAAAVTLLDGVTGSGKTEVYFEAVAETLRQGRQALVLLPEIALSAQWLERFQRRFGVRPAVWHSEMTATQRRGTWRAVALGQAPVLVGARSALFLPYPDLGLIVVDEEQDSSYKQDDGAVYHARDMAVVRGHLGRIPVILVSATPSLETHRNVEIGRYQRLTLTSRHGAASLPAISLIDLRRETPPRLALPDGGSGQSWLSPPLRAAIAETLGEGDQVLLYLNRRGYAPLTLCRACGHRLQCPHCTAWLVEHRFSARLQCHHCGHAARLPDTCGACHAVGTLAACGPGVERLSEEVGLLYPAARQGLMVSDTLRGPGAAQALLDAIEAREIDIIIGTQVAAKGHHFPHLTLVGVVDADLGLYGGDLRAAERTYQLLHQVAGRAGRAERPGRVLIQTAEPDHPVMEALAGDDRDRFLEVEAEQRRAAGLPPYGRLAALLLSDSDPERVEIVARQLRRKVPAASEIEVLGPAPAPLALLRGRHRWRFLVKARRAADLQGFIRAWLAGFKPPGALRLQIDIDPYGFL